jgi:preprotein translocase subunit YajC
MDTLYFTLAQAADAGSGGTQTPGGLGGILSSPIGMTIIMVGFIAFFYFVIVRPQNKKRKQHEQMMSAISKGDKVVSIGGIHGKVVSVKDNAIVVRIGANTEITFDKSAISRVVGEKSVDTGKKDAKKDTKKIETKTEDK